jgi:hypothetical protein
MADKEALDALLLHTLPPGSFSFETPFFSTVKLVVFKV